ncbi:MAG: peptidoglycan DD-metalloendopeptidase family protein [Rhizobiaceae bacterium]|nr:peptidoglycan DD-metalloendopeptidase family protein [Rhizobiaceae bacterium]
MSVFLVLSVSTAIGQTLETKQQHNSERLDEIRQQISLSEQRKAELAVEISATERDRADLNRELIDASSKSRKLEIQIERTGNRLQKLEQQNKNLRLSLRERRGLLSEVLAALQRMGRKPPPALLVRPEDALSSVRSAILLGAVVPEIRSETDILITELKELARIADEINSQRKSLHADLKRQAEEEERLTLLLAEKQRRTKSARTNLAKESAKVAQLAANATSLNRLIEQLETEISSARKAAELARQAEDKLHQEEQKRIASARQDIEKLDFSDTNRIEPAMKFSSAKGLLPKPVNGVEMVPFGEPDSFGIVSNGISIATRINARIVSPADGWVIYSGPFRSYGQLLILNAGGGYHIVLAGMKNTYVALGQFVLAGEPIGIMGAQRLASVDAMIPGSTRPILYVEFRKNKKSIDPAPWWADISTKRAYDDS